ncbi:MAG: hypothetical protein L3J00_07605 [Thiomicrorhabdus sp.]|nr:hypothetical protein [Thiomicrorhabdus sp.]
MNVLSKKWMVVLSVVFTSFLLTACGGVPVKEVSSNSVSMTVEKKEQVRKAIKTAGASLGWIIKDIDSNTLEATLLVRSHVAKVTIPYSGKEYSLLYKSSENLKYDAEKNTIHKNYNSWITNLDRKIQVQLSAL